MDDLISRQAALDALEWKWAGKAAIDAIKALPSAQPEIIMCKECKNHYFCAIEDEARDETFFCKWGERRD